MKKNDDTAKNYSFNIESQLFHQLSKEQQILWKKEIEEAYTNGKKNGIEQTKRKYNIRQ